MTRDYGVPAPGFRLPSGTRLGAVRLQIADLDRSLAWYEGVLGFRVLTRTDGGASLGVPASARPLIELHVHAGAAPSPPHGRLGLYHFAILVPDRVAIGQLIRRLAPSGVLTGASDHFVSEALYMQDPDGLGIEIYADRPRSSWQVDGDQLRMSTDPLDVEGLVAAAGDHPWEGMPGGTVIGHVHLHVGDIGQAAGFYHELLGFDKMVWSYPGALFLSAGGYHHHLGTNTWAAHAQPPSPGDAQLLEWTIIVPSAADVSAAATSLEAGGAKLEWDDTAVITADQWHTSVRIEAVT